MILIFSLFILGGCGSDRDKQLIMVTEAGFAPYEFYENGEIVGVDVEIAREIAEAMGKELVVKDVAFDFIINDYNTKTNEQNKEIARLNALIKELEEPEEENE